MSDVTAPKSPLLLAAIQLGLLLLAVYYAFIGGQTAQGIYDHQWRAITLWLTAIMLGGWLLGRMIGRPKIPRTPLDYPLIFLLVAWVLATLLSVNPTYSRETLVFFGLYLFFFYLAADLGRWPWLTELLFNAIIAVSGLVWTLGAWQLLRWSQNLPPAPTLLEGQASDLAWVRLSVLGNPNTMASFVALVFPIVLYKLTSASRLATRLLLLLWVVMLAGAGLLTQSRGGLVGLVVAGGFYLAVWWWQRWGGAVAGRAGTPAKKWLLAGGVVAGLGLALWLLLNLRSTGGAVGVRQQVMAGALETWQAHPLTGAGPGALGEELVRRQEPLDTIWADAHNLPLTLAAETGLIGLAGLVWLAAAGFKQIWLTFRAGDKARWNLAGMACLAALLGFAAHNLVDSLFKFPIIMLLVAIWAGIWLSPPQAGRSTRYWGYPAMVGAMLLLLALTFMGWWDLRHIGAYNRAVAAVERGDWPAAVDYLQQADQLAPNMPFYQRQLGFVTGYRSHLLAAAPAGRAEAQRLRDEAIGRYQAALAQVDRLPIDHANLACLLWAAGRPEAAQQQMRQARTLAPENITFRLNLGYYLEQSGDYPAAWEQYGALLAARPDYLHSSYWQQSDLRAGAKAEIIDRAAQRLLDGDNPDWSRSIQLFLQAGDVGRAGQIYEEYLAQSGNAGPESRLAKGRILVAEGRLAEARAVLETILADSPMAADAYLLLGEIALTQARPDGATRYLEAAVFLDDRPEIIYQAGLAAAATGNEKHALELYEAAFQQLTVPPPDLSLPRYATEVARRRPLPVGHLPCLQRIYPSQLLVDITLAEGDVLERQGRYPQAGRIYQRLLSFEPDSTVIQARLEALCQQDPRSCDFRAN